MEEKEKEMEQWNDVKDKKGSGIVIVLLLLIIAGLGCFIFLNKDKLFGEKETKEPEQTEKEEVEETVTFTDEELQKYVNYISPISSGPSAKLFNVDKVVASELSASEKIEYIGHEIQNKQISSTDYKYSIVSEEDVKNAVETVYGPNTYERKTFNLGCGDYEYDEEDGRYYSQTGCGGTTDKLSQNVVIDYKATNNKLEITTAYAFTDSGFQIYKDYDYKTAVGEFQSDYSEMRNELAKYIKEHKDELNHIVYTFESTDGTNYYFKQFVNNR